MSFSTEFMLEVSREAEDFERFAEDLWLLRCKRREEKDELLVKDRSLYDREELVKDSSPGLQSIIRRLEFARAELCDMEQYRSLTYSTYNDDRAIRRNVERMIENICNAVFDIGKIVLSEYDTEMPTSYRDIFVKLKALGVINASLHERLVHVVRVRNIISQQYMEIKWDYIRDFIVRDSDAVRVFLQTVERFLRVPN